MTETNEQTEMLARMWIECDPNRGGVDAEETITMFEPTREVPHWHWFIPRAEATVKYLEKHGYMLVKAGE